MNFQHEIIKSIKNIFESSFTTKAISEETGLGYTTVNELRNKKRDISNSNFDNCLALYNFAVEHKLNQEILDVEKRKGTYDTINLQLGVEKVLVSFNRLDLFSLGYMVVKNSYELLEKDKLVQLELSNSLFITESKQCYATNEFGKRFDCNFYDRNNENDFSDFVEQYSKIDKEIIRKTIFENEIVSYDFRKDKIQGNKSNMNLDGIALNNYNSKLVITIDKCNLKCYINKIEIIISILDKYYYKDIKLKRISYIHNYESDDTKKYRITDINRVDYRIILEYDNFEIWIPHNVIDKSNGFDIEKIKGFINGLGIEVNNTLQNLNKSNTYRINIFNSYY